MYSCTLSLTSSLDRVGGQRHASAVLPPGKSRYPMYMRLGGPQEPSETVRQISSRPGFDPRTFQPVANRYTDYPLFYVRVFVCICLCVFANKIVFTCKAFCRFRVFARI